VSGGGGALWGRGRGRALRGVSVSRLRGCRGGGARVGEDRWTTRARQWERGAVGGVPRWGWCGCHGVCVRGRGRCSRGVESEIVGPRSPAGEGGVVKEGGGGRGVGSGEGCWGGVRWRRGGGTGVGVGGGVGGRGVCGTGGGGECRSAGSGGRVGGGGRDSGMRVWAREGGRWVGGGPWGLGVGGGVAGGGGRGGQGGVCRPGAACLGVETRQMCW